MNFHLLRYKRATELICGTIINQERYIFDDLDGGMYDHCYADILFIQAMHKVIALGIPFDQIVFIVFALIKYEMSFDEIYPLVIKVRSNYISYLIYGPLPHNEKDKIYYKLLRLYDELCAYGEYEKL